MAPTVAVGAGKAPEPDGQPGFPRVDAVRQGDEGGVKGIYLIILIDQTTQFELATAAAAITERFLLPVPAGLLEQMPFRNRGFRAVSGGGSFACRRSEQMPFRIRGFRADNGSEYVNHRVADPLAKLHVEFTKSRRRRRNDNVPIEGKNARVVRKYFDRDHIPQRFAARVNAFARQRLSPFPNYQTKLVHSTRLGRAFVHHHFLIGKR